MCGKMHSDFGRREAPFSCEKSERNWHPHRCVKPRILLLWQKVCVKRHQHQFTVVLNNWTSRRHHRDEFCIKTPYKVQLVQELKPVDHPMRFCFAKWVCDRITEDAAFGKKKNHIFRWSSFWSWREQAKLSHLGYRKPARIHWKADAPKTSDCLVRILVQRHNWSIFILKWASRSQYRSLSGHFERIFVHKTWRGGHWQHLVSTGRR